MLEEFQMESGDTLVHVDNPRDVFVTLPYAEVGRRMEILQRGPGRVHLRGNVTYPLGTFPATRGQFSLVTAVRVYGGWALGGDLARGPVRGRYDMLLDEVHVW